MPQLRKLRMVLVGTVAAMVLSGCSWTGLNSMALPFTKGGGSGDLHLTVLMANAANLVPNSEVKYNDVTVGSVRKIQLVHWTATLSIGIEKGVQIPADVTAKIAQKSLLGAEYLDLSAPTGTTTAASAGFLHSGDVIGLNRTSRYPETEEVLTAAALVLNGGGISQINTITRELNDAFGGRAQDIKSFMTTVSSFTASLDTQRNNIATTLTQLNRLAGDVNNNRAQISQILKLHPRVFQMLDQEHGQLVNTLNTVSNFSTVAHRVISETKVGLQQNLQNLIPVTAALARNGTKLANSVQDLTYPFATNGVVKDLGGDYLNLITTIEVSAPDLLRDWAGSTALDGLFTGVVAGAPTGAASQGNTGKGNGLTSLMGQVSGLISGGTPTSKSSSNTTQGGTPSTPNSSTKSSGNVLGQLLGGL